MCKLWCMLSKESLDRLITAKKYKILLLLLLFVFILTMSCFVEQISIFNLEAIPGLLLRPCRNPNLTLGHPTMTWPKFSGPPNHNQVCYVILHDHMELCLKARFENLLNTTLLVCQFHYLFLYYSLLWWIFTKNSLWPFEWGLSEPDLMMILLDKLAAIGM